MPRPLPALLRVALASLAVACAPKTPRPAMPAPPADPPAAASAGLGERYADADFAFAFPEGWMPFPPSGAARIIVRSPGAGALAADETGAPLQVGLAVEVYEGPYTSPDDFAAQVRAGVEGDPAVEHLHRVESWDVPVCGGYTGRLHVFEFDKAGTDRRSQYQKLSVVDSWGRGWIALSWAVASRESRLVAGDSPLTLRLRPWVASFCPAPGQIDDEALRRGLEGAETGPG